MRSSSATGPSYVRRQRTERTDEERRQCDDARPNRGGDEDVDEHEPPGEMRAVLQLAESHLDDQQDRHRDGEREQPRRAISTRGEIAEAEDERGAEHADGRRMTDQYGPEGREPVDVLAAAGVRTCGRRKS